MSAAGAAAAVDDRSDMHWACGRGARPARAEPARAPCSRARTGTTPLPAPPRRRHAPPQRRRARGVDDRRQRGAVGRRLGAAAGGAGADGGGWVGLFDTCVAGRLAGWLAGWLGCADGSLLGLRPGPRAAGGHGRSRSQWPAPHTAPSRPPPCPPQGGDLRAALSAEGAAAERLRWHAAGRQVALDIAAGLAWLHRNRVTHRDLKSRNVLLSADLRAKVADCGGAVMHSATHYGALAVWSGCAPGQLPGRAVQRRAARWGQVQGRVGCCGWLAALCATPGCADAPAALPPAPLPPASARP